MFYKKIFNSFKRRSIAVQDDRVQNVFYYMKGCIAWKDTEGVYRAASIHFIEKIKSIKGISHFYGMVEKDFFDPHISVLLSEQDQLVSAAKKRLVFDVDVHIENYLFARRIIKTPMYNAQGEYFGILVEYVLKPRPSALKAVKDDSDDLVLSFIRDMEHDLRTPLSGILGLARILFAQTHEQTTKDYLGLIVQSTEEVIEYCQNILAYSKMSRKMYPTIFKTFKLDDMLQKILMMQLPAAKNKNITLKIEKHGEIPAYIKTDIYRLEKIFVNLIANAIKFTDDGGVHVLIDYMMLFKNYSVISVIIKDTGQGLPEHVHVFLAQEPSEEQQEHTALRIGLGLQIVRDFVSDLGGDIQTFSQKDIGSEIHIIIPLQSMDNDYTKYINN